MQQQIRLLLNHSAAPPFTGDQDGALIMRLYNGKDADAQFEEVLKSLIYINEQYLDASQSNKFDRELIYAMNRMIGALLFDRFSNLDQIHVLKCRTWGKVLFRAWEAIVEGDCQDLLSYAYELE
jgi:hypothetical protein